MLSWFEHRHTRCRSQRQIYIGPIHLYRESIALMSDYWGKTEEHFFLTLCIKFTITNYTPMISVTGDVLLICLYDNSDCIVFNMRVEGRGCHTLLKPYETNCDLWIWAMQIKFDWLIEYMILFKSVSSSHFLPAQCPLWEWRSSPCTHIHVRPLYRRWWVSYSDFHCQHGPQSMAELLCCRV